MTNNLPALVQNFKTLVPFVADLFVEHFGDEEAAAAAYASESGQQAAQTALVATTEEQQIKILDATLMMMQQIDADPALIQLWLKAGYRIDEIQVSYEAFDSLALREPDKAVLLIMNLRRRFGELLHADDLGETLDEIITDLRPHFASYIPLDEEEDEDDVTDFDDEVAEAIHSEDDSNFVLTILKALLSTGKTNRLNSVTQVVTLLENRSK